MAKYIVRIVLHDAKEPEDYDRLHEFMKAAGFERTIASDDRTVWHLPPAMYLAVTDDPIQRVRDVAGAKASMTGRQHSEFVVEYTSAAWQGLEKVHTFAGLFAR